MAPLAPQSGASCLTSDVEKCDILNHRANPSDHFDETSRCLRSQLVFMEMNRGVAELVEQIDRMVETAASSPALGEAELRRVLRFLSQVIQVVEQAFQDVFTLLVDIKFLDPGDIRSSRLMELRKQVDLLTARSYYRDAAEICSRLKHLRHSFDEYVRGDLDKLPSISGWNGILGLIEDREGRIIMLIERTARQMGDMLDNINEGSLPIVRSKAAQSAEQLRSLLSELHELNGRILGYSGTTGFLELTRNRRELQREVQIMIDKRDQSVTHGHRVQVGDHNTGQVVVATTIQDSFNHISRSNATEKMKKKLELLCSQVQDLMKDLPNEKQKDVGQDLSNFVTEATKESPRRKWYELSSEGLIDAAKACAGMASPVIKTVKEILSLISSAS
jgi:hypothetical protein